MEARDSEQQLSVKRRASDSAVESVQELLSQQVTLLVAEKRRRQSIEAERDDLERRLQRSEQLVVQLTREKMSEGHDALGFSVNAAFVSKLNATVDALLGRPPWFAEESGNRAYMTAILQQEQATRKLEENVAELEQVRKLLSNELHSYSESNEAIKPSSCAIVGVSDGKPELINKNRRVHFNDDITYAEAPTNLRSRQECSTGTCPSDAESEESGSDDEQFWHDSSVDEAIVFHSEHRRCARVGVEDFSTVLNKLHAAERPSDAESDDYGGHDGDSLQNSEEKLHIFHSRHRRRGRVGLEDFCASASREHRLARGERHTHASQNEPLARRSQVGGHGSEDSLDVERQECSERQRVQMQALCWEDTQLPCNVTLSCDRRLASFSGDKHHESTNFFGYVATSRLSREQDGYFFEIIVKKVLDVHDDGLAIGFTATPPSRWPTPLPHTADSIEKTWLVGYDGEMIDGTERTWTRCSWKPKSLKEGDRIGAEFSLDGRFAICVNDTQVFETCTSPINDVPELFGVVDLIGNTNEIELYDVFSK